MQVPANHGMYAGRWIRDTRDKGYIMENTSNASPFGFAGSKIIYIVALTAVTCIISRSPLMGSSFICGTSLIAYMLSKSTLNIYLIVPAVLGLLPYISRGYDPWGYVAAMILCGLVFTASRKVKFQLWQRALTAASVSIIAVSVYSLLAGEVYRTSPEKLAIEGALVFAIIYIFDAISVKPPQNRLTMAAFITTSLLIINGLGLSFLLWMVVIFMALWTLACTDMGTALTMVLTGGLAASFMEQSQWGLMATIMLGILAASYAKAHGFVLMTAVFAIACWLAGFAESGVVLGIDKYCLLLPSIAFIAVYWRFGSSMRNILGMFAGQNEVTDETSSGYMDTILEDKASQISDLAELYATYLDSRSMLANQFNVTKQVIEDIRWQVSRQGKRLARKENCRLEVDIAISQCAATGAINGDCCGWQELGDGRVVMVVSDGMGKGKKAAAESLMVTRTMISLLKAGVTTDLALKMINTIMLMKDDEDSYATLDMVTVDKHTGRAKFYKIGAAPTLIRRKSNVEEVKLSAVPLGIVNGLKIRYVETTLKKDDWIIMMSDGVSDGGLLQKTKETVADVRSTDPQTMSDLIINRAADSYIGRERDDLTVMVARIV